MSSEAGGAQGRIARHGAAVLRTQANQGELILAIARILLSIALVVRYFVIDGPAHGDPIGHITERVGGNALVIAVSLWIVTRARVQGFGRAAHVGWAAFDSIICFHALRTDVLWATGSYAGLLRMPDVSFIAVIVFGSALRLFWEAVLTSILMNAMSLALLVRLDLAINHARISFGSKDVEIVCLQLMAASAAAMVCRWATGRAIRQSAVEAERVARGRRYLDEILLQHHDLRTLLSTVRLQLGLLRREIECPGGRERLGILERATGRVVEIVEGIKGRTFRELAVTDELAVVSLGAVLAPAISLMRDRFTSIAIEASKATESAKVVIFGGERALAHVVVNILANACEGDGERGPSRVDVHLETAPDAESVMLEFADDGPGFPPQLLETPCRAGMTTKRGGTGIGLPFVAELVGASGGSLRLRNAPKGGARVLLSLRAPS